MIDITVGEKLSEIWPQTSIGCIQANVTVKESSKELWQEISRCCETLKYEIKDTDGIALLPRIKDGRDAYRSLGKSPGKYRLASEALARRVIQNKGVYRINNVVEINNLISLKSGFSVGSYNIENLYPPVSLTIGKEGQEYKGIGKALVNIGDMPVLSDTRGSFGSPTSDSERAMITNDVNKIVMCIFSFSGRTGIEDSLLYAKKLLVKYAGANEIETVIV